MTLALVSACTAHPVQAHQQAARLTLLTSAPDDQHTGLTFLPPAPLPPQTEKSEFLELFYDKHMGKLLAPLSAAPGEPAAVPVSTLGLIVDLLCFCAQNHQFRIKYYSLRNNGGEKVGGQAACCW